MRTDTLPLRRVEQHRTSALDRGAWPANVPSVATLLDAGLDLGPATVLTGDNGTGKSTLIEAIAIAFGLNPEGGTANVRHHTRRSESELGEHLQLVRNAGASKRGFFLRAETAHGLFTYLEDLGGEATAFHERSHGESFLDLLTSRASIPGLWLLDEPESALSFTGCLALLRLLGELIADGSQVVLSTHSPVLAALPGATVLELGDWGIRNCKWEHLDLVRHHKDFLAAPQRYLRHLV